jgi:hypothetical protein
MEFNIMTISSYPNIKLFTAIISAIVVGILVSWVWGIASFFIFMFIFIFVAAWISEIFTSIQTKGKVKVTYELEELLDNLESIGNLKNQLPLNARGWCNVLGLYVQLKSKGGLTRLQAGDKKHSQIDVWIDHSNINDRWKVKKYECGDWEKLVDPTLDIANWLSKCRGLPEEYTDSFKSAIKVFRKEGHLELPHHTIETGLGIKEQINATTEITENVAPEQASKTLSLIEEYDSELLKDIQRLEDHISENELLAKDLMRSYDTTDRVIEEVANEARDQGRPISLFGSGSFAFEILGFLKEIGPIYKNYTFRAWHRRYPPQCHGMNILTQDGSYKVNTCLFNDDERREYAEHCDKTMMQNIELESVLKEYPSVFHDRGYPDIPFMSFIADMLKKYESNNILTKDDVNDEKLSLIDSELLREKLSKHKENKSI